MSMSIATLQELIGADADGMWGPRSKAALLKHFANLHAPALTAHDVDSAAARIGCWPRQLRAVLKVETLGGGFDVRGRPKILYERHKFHRFTGGAWSPCAFSQRAGGGYTVDADRNGVNDNWDRLSMALATGAVDAAFMACSWGLGQVMGEWWDELDYASPYAMAAACIESEAAQLELMVRYIEHFGLQDEIKALTSNPDHCAPFAAAYNGPGYRKGEYHLKLAHWMGELP